MRLTVVVPVYNVEKYIRKCVDSIIAQTYQQIEIILVDDGSTDNSRMIADEYSNYYPNVRTIHQTNQGLSSARNTGINSCQTELIAFVDSDDYIEPDMYENLIRHLDENEADISIGGVFRENMSGEKFSVYPANVKKVFSKKQALIELNSLKYFNMSVWNVLFKTELFNMAAYEEETVRFPIGKKSEDEYTIHKLYARAKKVVYTSTPYYHYLQRPNSITNSSRVNTEQVDASMTRVQFYERWFPDIAYSAKSECIFACMALTNTFLVKEISCPVKLEEKMHGISKQYLAAVVKNKHVRIMKKAQVVMYVVTPKLYKCIMQGVKKMRKK